MTRSPGVAAIAPPSTLPERRAAFWRRNSPLGMLYGAVLTVFYSVLFLVPFGTAIWLSFQNWDYLTMPRFVGLRHYVKALGHGYFWMALKTSALFSVVEISVAMALALLLALMLSQMRGRWQNLFLTLYYLPVITPGVVTIYLWRWMYNPTGGTFNTVLASLGLPQQPFLASGQQALWCITAMVIWANLGGAAVILLAGINDIPTSIIEAARLDGAGIWQTFLRITLPMIRPVLVYQVVVSVIGTVQMFEPFFLMPGPGFSTRTLSLYTYQLGFTSMNLGYGAALSLIIFLLLLAATVFQLQRWQVTWEH